MPVTSRNVGAPSYGNQKGLKRLLTDNLLPRIFEQPVG